MCGARYVPKIKNVQNKNPVKGASKNVADVFIDGTNYVTKHTVRILLRITQCISNFFIVILYSKKNVSFTCMFLLLLPSFLRKNFEKITVIKYQNNLHGQSIFITIILKYQ